MFGLKILDKLTMDEKRGQLLINNLGLILSLDFVAILNLVELRKDGADYKAQPDLFEKIEKLSYFPTKNYSIDVLQRLENFLNSNPEFLQLVLAQRRDFGYRVDDSFIDFMFKLYMILENNPSYSSEQILDVFTNNNGPIIGYYFPFF